MSKTFSDVLQRDNILTGCSSKTRSPLCSSWDEAMFPRATLVGWLSEHCTALISLPALGIGLGMHPQNHCSLIVQPNTSFCLFFCSIATFHDSLWAPCLFSRFRLWYSEVKTGLKLSNLKSEIRAGEGYYLWVDSDWIGSRGSNTPKWQLGVNPGPFYLRRKPGTTGLTKTAECGRTRWWNAP